METGMLWFDNDPKKSLNLKIQQAVDYYRNKYGCSPNLCLVNPGNLVKSNQPSETSSLGSVMIRPFRSVLPGHLWIGMEDKNTAVAG